MRSGARIAAAAHALVVAVACGYLGLFLVLTALRVPYPFELEWMEGGAVDHVRWLLAGNCLYGPPSLRFVPFIYTPLYFWICAPVAAVIGTDFIALRLVSLAATLGSFGVIGWFVARETSSRAAGWLAAGVFAATFRVGGAWFDIARVDMLMVFFLLAGLVVLRRGDSARADAAAGFLFFLAFLAKQVALIVAGPLVLYVLLARRGWRRFWLPGVLGGLVLVSTLILQAASDGWYLFYVFDLPSQHAVADHYHWRGFWQEDVLEEIPLLLLFALALPLVVGKHDVRGALLAGLLWLGGVASAWLARLHSGGWDNVLVPLHAVIALLGVLGYEALRHRWRERPPLQIVLALLMLVQLALLRYSPAAQVPTPADRAAGDALVARLRAIEGDVFVPYHGHYSVMAGKPAWVQGAALTDVIRGKNAELTERCHALLRRALAEGRFAALVLDEPMPELEQVDRPYVDVEAIFADPDVFWPVTGRRIRPERLWLRRESAMP